MKALKYILVFLCLAGVQLIFACEVIESSNHGSATYYASAGGSGTTCSSASPCSLTTGLGKVVAGDTLYLKDGVYNQSLNIKKSGTSGAYITIKAQNDGQAVIDGQGARRPCYIEGQSYLNVEGIVCKNSNNSVFGINKSSHINIKRVSAYNVLAEGNYHAFPVNYSNNILLEDCAASGTARVLYNLQSSQRVTLRRCWGRYTASARADGPYVGIQVYGSDDSIVENCVITRGSGSNVQGINIWAHKYNPSADRNKIYGNVVYGLDFTGFSINSEINLIRDNIYRNNVSIDNYIGFNQRADNNLLAEKLTVVGASGKGAYRLNSDRDLTGTSGTVKNSSFYNNSGYGIKRINSKLHHSYNNLYGVRSCYSGLSAGMRETCNSLNPKYDTATYGKGAYLMVPADLQGRGEEGGDIGAQVLYRYKNGVLSNEPLWPWPMEDRIFKETGVSVTRESKGGLWKTLDGVYGPD